MQGLHLRHDICYIWILIPVDNTFSFAFLVLRVSKLLAVLPLQLKVSVSLEACWEVGEGKDDWRIHFFLTGVRIQGTTVKG